MEKGGKVVVARPSLYRECNKCETATSRIDEIVNETFGELPQTTNKVKILCKIEPRKIVRMSAWRSGTLQIGQNEPKPFSGSREERDIHCPGLHRD